MAHTIVSPFGQALAANLAPWMTDSLAVYVDAIGSMFDPVYTLVAEQGSDGDAGYVPTWGVLFDPDLCPTAQLGFLAQFVGVEIPEGTSDDDARALIRQEAGMARGTVASLRSAIERSISVPWRPNTAYTAHGPLVRYPSSPAASTVFYDVTTGFTSGATFSATNLRAVDQTAYYDLRERQQANGTADAYAMTIQVRPEQLTPAGNDAALVAAVAAVKPAGIIVYYVVADSPRWQDATLTWGAVAGTVTWGNVQAGDV